MANAGRVAIVPKGEYNSATAYKRLDLVRYNNAVYVAKKANTGVSPTKTDTWMLCIQNVTQEQYDAIINGTKKVGKSKEADNALTLNGKTIGEFLYAGNVDAKVTYYSLNNNKDCNDIEELLVLAGGADGLHYPTENAFYYIFTIKYNDGTKKQVALNYGGHQIFTRYCKSGTWSDWDNPKNGGDAASVNGFAIYNDISQLSTTSWYIPSIVKSMPEYSMFVAACGSSKSELYIANEGLPYQVGNLEILKLTGGRTRILYASGESATKHDIYYGDIDETNWVVNGWKHIGDGCDALTLGGKKASDFLPADGTAANSSKLENLTAQQVGESGVSNLFDTAFRFNRDDDGVVAFTNENSNGIINGTSTENDTVLYYDPDRARIKISPLGVGDTMTVSMTVLSGTYTAPGTQGSFYFDIIDSTGTRLTKFGVCGLYDAANNIGTTFSKTFTMTQELKDAGAFYLYPQIWKNIGDVFKNLELQIMIEHGSVAHNYVPYHRGGAEDAKTLDGKKASDFLPATGTAAKATADANGNNIASTYKTKAESVNVKISTTAPSDTSVVWVDTANKVTKIYKDGAWTALA